jgi:hypothetical protein
MVGINTNESPLLSRDCQVSQVEKWRRVISKNLRLSFGHLQDIKSRSIGQFWLGTCGFRSVESTHRWMCYYRALTIHMEKHSFQETTSYKPDAGSESTLQSLLQYKAQPLPFLLRSLVSS